MHFQYIHEKEITFILFADVLKDFLENDSREKADICSELMEEILSNYTKSIQKLIF